MHRLVHGSDWTRSLPRLLMRQVHDVRLVHRSADLGVGAARSRSNSLFFFFPPPPPSFPASPYFPFLSPLLLLERPPPRAGAKMWRDMELRKESGAERLRAWLSRRAAPSQWLGEEVKAPATLASQRLRLFGAVAVSVAGMRVAFSPFCRPHLCNNNNKKKHRPD